MKYLFPICIIGGVALSIVLLVWYSDIERENIEKNTIFINGTIITHADNWFSDYCIVKTEDKPRIKVRCSSLDFIGDTVQLSYYDNYYMMEKNYAR